MKTDVLPAATTFLARYRAPMRRSLLVVSAWAAGVLLCSHIQADITLSYAFGDGIEGINGGGAYQSSVMGTAPTIKLICRNAFGGGAHSETYPAGSGEWLHGVSPLDPGHYLCEAQIQYFDAAGNMVFALSDPIEYVGTP